MRKIFADAMGGDHPEQVIAGLIKASRQLTDTVMTLVGDEKFITETCTKYDLGLGTVDIINCPVSIAMNATFNESYTDGQNSMSLAAKLAFESGGGFISAGNTALMYGIATLQIPLFPWITRPGLALTFSGKSKGIKMLMDAGGMVDCKAPHLVNFAEMAIPYYQMLHGKCNPTVGLLSVGTEDTKGSFQIKKANELLRALNPRLNFIGNVEGSQLFKGPDIIIADGSAANALFKGAEGTAEFLFEILKEEFQSNLWFSLLAFLLKPCFRRVKKRLDYQEIGGAVILGSQIPLVKLHGISDSKASEIGAHHLDSIMEREIIPKTMASH